MDGVDAPTWDQLNELCKRLTEENKLLKAKLNKALTELDGKKLLADRRKVTGELIEATTKLNKVKKILKWVAEVFDEMNKCACDYDKALAELEEE